MNPWLRGPGRGLRTVTLSVAIAVLSIGGHALGQGHVSGFGMAYVAVMAVVVATVLTRRQVRMRSVAAAAVGCQVVAHSLLARVDAPMGLSGHEHHFGGVRGQHASVEIAAGSLSMGTHEWTMIGAHLLAAGILGWLMHACDDALFAFAAAVDRAFAVLARPVLWRPSPLSVRRQRPVWFDGSAVARHQWYSPQSASRAPPALVAPSR